MAVERTEGEEEAYHEGYRDGFKQGTLMAEDAFRTMLEGLVRNDAS